MERTVDKSAAPVIVARTSIKRRSDQHRPDHGFFNARNASLPELPLRDWGRMAVRPPAAVPARRDAE